MTQRVAFPPASLNARLFAFVTDGIALVLAGWVAVIRSLVLYIASPIAVVTALLRQDQRGVHDLAARTEVVVK